MTDFATAPACRLRLLAMLAKEPDDDEPRRLIAARDAFNLLVNDSDPMLDPDWVADVASCLHTAAGARELLRLTTEQWLAARSVRELAIRVPLAVPLVGGAAAREIASAYTWAEELLRRLTIYEIPRPGRQPWNR
jgi:hypothetical protein